MRPTRIELIGFEKHVEHGEEVTLTCIVGGAKPAANVTWQNDTEPIQLQADNKFQKEVSEFALKTVILKYNVVTVLVSLSYVTFSICLSYDRPL